jgi:YNFM family putative membrane transporter
MSSSAGYRLGDRGYRRVAVALFLAGLATFAQLYSVQPLLPEFSRAFEVSATTSTLALSLSTFTLAIAMLVIGPLSEVVGRTRLIHLSLFASAAVGGMAALAPSWSAFLILRTVEGLVLAGLPAVGMAYLREEVHDNVHARAAGLYVAGTAMGGMSGRLIAGGLADLGGWRMAVGGVALVSVAAAVTVRILLPPSRNFVPARPHPGELVRMGGRLFTDPALLALYGIAVTAMGAFVAVYNAISFRLVNAPYHLSVAAVGLIFLIYPVGAFASTYAGALASRFGRRPVLPAAALIGIVGLVMTLGTPLPVVILGLAVMTAGFFAAHGVASGWVTTRAQAGVGGPGLAVALYLFFYYVGSSIFGSLAGDAWESGGWPMVVVMAGVLLLVALVLSVALRRSVSLLPSRDAPPRSEEGRGT